jgi:YVTN family beta-propeller protein
MLMVILTGVTGTALMAVRNAELAATSSARYDVPRVTASGTLLPNGWVLHPAGRQITTGDLPLAMAVAPDGENLLVTTGGYAPCRVLTIDTDNEQLETAQGVDQLWEGMAFGPKTQVGSELYISGGGRGLIWRYTYDRRGGDLIRREPLAIPGLVGREPPYVTPKRAQANAWMAGMACNPTDGTLYVLNNQGATLYALDPATGAVKAQVATGDHPNAVALSPDGKRVCVTNQGGASVSVFQAAGLTKITDVAVGKQPVALLYSSDGARLFVANSGSDTVSVIDGATLAVDETIRTTLFPEAPTGSTPNALALAPDGKRLFVTNADNNDVAVLDVSRPHDARVLGFIPTGWYPTAVAVSHDGKKLFVGVGKGLASKPSFPRVGGGVGLNIYNKPGQSYGKDHDRSITFDYICSLLGGAVSVVDMPDDAQLTRYTAQVISGCPYRDELLKRTAWQVGRTVIPTVVGQASPIKYILYIIKENRTYDQVFGDLKEGNGDPNLTLFGEQVTPNHHALAQQFVLLDNLYCNGEVSEDGHQWCNAAFCTDWTEKVYPGNYATPSRGDAPGSEEVAASTGGYLWDNCARHGLTYRTYGEFTSFHSDKDTPPVATSGSPNLRGHISLAWELAARQGKRRDYQRVDAFLDELKEAERTGDWPNYMVMSLGEDHTVGLTPGLPTPWAAVASNDLALGRIVEGVSHSRYWKETAIFVIEDDAQAGPDHVDAHRTVGLVISPYTRRRCVDHTFYTTASFIRSMELLLGLPPMTQYDAGATPLYNSFTDRLNLTPYTVVPARTDLAATNPRRGMGASASAHLDFSGYDRCDPDILNRLLWHAIRGEEAPYPSVMAGIQVALQSAERR